MGQQETSNHHNSLSELRPHVSRILNQHGGRSWWAHLNFTRMNTGPIIL
jgi:hypothetical protein